MAKTIETTGYVACDVDAIHGFGATATEAIEMLDADDIPSGRYFVIRATAALMAELRAGQGGVGWHHWGGVAYARHEFDGSPDDID